MSRWAPDDAAGNHAYVVTIYEPGAPGRTQLVVYAASLVDAKAAHGRRVSPRERRSVRRATVQDVPAKVAG